MRCTYFPGQGRWVHFFMKYDYEFKLERVKEHLNGKQVYCPSGISRYCFMNHVRDWVYIYKHKGEEGLKHSNLQKQWTPEEKFNLITKVFAGDTVANVARQNFINNGQLFAWLKKYRENGYDGLKLDHRGRKPRVINMTRKIKVPKITPSEYEELKLLRERNLYLEAENLYLKKLRALELKKQAAQTKAKKQK